MDSQVSPIVANLYMEYFEQKALSTAPNPRFGRGMWMTHLSSRRKSTNRTSYNTLTVLTLPSPSWTPLLDPPTQTSIYSGIVTTTSQKNLVLLTPSPTGTKQCVAILSFSAKKWITSRRLIPNANTLNGLWTRWRKGLMGLQGGY